MSNQAENQVPKALRNWFVVHFVVDIIFAIPMMFVPDQFLTLMGWQTIDVIATRIAAAALFGIGIESYIGRNSPIEVFTNMITLKIIWSFSVIFGIIVSLIEGAQNQPMMAYLILFLFIAFNILWIYWKIKLNKS